MSKRIKRYTAQEMRNAADLMQDSINDIRDGNDRHWQKDSDTPKDWEAMLLQAADTEDKLAKARIDADLYKGASENWERRARIAEARQTGCAMSDFEKMILVAFKMGDIRGRFKYDPIQRKVMSWVPRRGVNRGYWAYIDSSRFVEAFNRFFTDHKKEVLG